MTASMMTAVYAIITAAEHGWTSAHTLAWGGAAAIMGVAFLSCSRASPTRSSPCASCACAP